MYAICSRVERCDTNAKDTVMFGEEIRVKAEHTAKHALRDCDLFVAFDTSGTVAPASSFVRWAELKGARRVLLNLEPTSSRVRGDTGIAALASTILARRTGG